MKRQAQSDQRQEQSKAIKTAAAATMSSSSPAYEILSTTTVTANGGLLHRVKHASSSTGTDMIFAIFLPSSYMVDKGSIPAICK